MYPVNLAVPPLPKISCQSRSSTEEDDDDNNDNDDDDDDNEDQCVE